MVNGKWSVLIVDDEFRIAMLIKKLIHWEEYNMECLDIVDNGEKAFQIIQEKKPDIVITDIRMPKINGLDLAKMTRELYPEIQFVIISGYKEFEYAHRALQYEVDGYLLKPINENELNEVLNKIYEKYKKETFDFQEQKKLQETITASRKIIKRDFLKNIIDHRQDLEMENSHLNMSGDIYRGIDIKLDYTDYLQMNKKQDKITVNRVVAIVEQLLGQVAEEVLICEKENLHIYCLFNYNFDNAKSVRNSINDILSEIQNYLIAMEQYEVTIGVGAEKQQFSDIRYSILESYRAVGNRIKLGTGRLIYVESLPVKEDVGKKYQEYKDQFEQAFETYSREKIEQSINALFSEYIIEDYRDCSVCYEIVEKMLEGALLSAGLPLEEYEGFRQRVLSTSQHCYSFSSLKNLLKKQLGEYISANKEAAESESVKPIRQAKQYIDEHYSEKIVLEDIAEIVGLNPVYFSVLFKKETEMNFSSYLVQVRIDKAKEMICGTNETIAAIAERVGYKDSRYFSQLFTKVVGVKPVLYRRLHS